MMDMFASDSDWESFSESGSSEEQEEIHSMYGGQARSIFSSLEESIGKINDFLSFERGFMHGDMVCSVTDPSGQMGRVLNVDMFVDLEHVHGKIIKDVNSKMLLRMRSISMGDYVVQGPWLGVVAKVVDTVTIMFDDGAMCEVTAMDQKKFLPICPNLHEDPQYPFYPGQRVQVRHSIASKSARWFCGSWNKNQDEGTVCSVKASLVYVDWLASAPIGYNMGLHALPAPPRLQESKNVTLLSCFSHANWQLGDWCIFPIANCKGVMEQMLCSSFTGEIIKEFMKVERGSKRRGLNSNFEEIFVIAKTKTKVDVVWQDGSSSLGLDSQSLLPLNVFNAHEFWPEQFVIERGTCDDPDVSCSQKWGVVRGVDANERTVNVKWENFAPEQGNDVGKEWMEETVSAYELVEHPDYSYCYGDVVFRMFQNQNIDQADKDHVNSEIRKGVEAALEERNCNRDQNEDSDKCYLSCIGNVVGFKDGSVEVRWANGLTTKVGPDEIFRIDKYLALTPIPKLSDQNVEELNQEIIEGEKQSSTPKGKDLLNSNSVGEDCPKHLWESSSCFLPQYAIGYFTSIAASLFRSLGLTSPSASMLSGHNYEYENKSKTVQESELEICSLLEEEEPLVEDEVQVCETTSLKQASKEIQENIDIPFSSDCKNSEQFRRFDMVGDCSDHHFLDCAGKKLASSQVKRGWLKKVQQEWSILENNLPETIYVRAYEERMDLLRAAIVGAPGTPYHDGIFFFDIHLPPEYPHEPPLVHYHSGGLRVNPNLYESGKVCLSLLNTWTGTATEVWNPGSSTILQVLLSLQALVLNDKPYFNEAGYDKQMGRAEGEKNSVSYNENAVLVTCQSMLYILRRPPKHFEAFVEEHFSRCSRHILLACKAYMEGAAIIYAFGNEQAEHEHLKGSSTGFKIMLSKLFPKLVEAFSEKGIDCSQFVAAEN